MQRVDVGVVATRGLMCGSLAGMVAGGVVGLPALPPVGLLIGAVVGAWVGLVLGAVGGAAIVAVYGRTTSRCALRVTTGGAVSAVTALMLLAWSAGHGVNGPGVFVAVVFVLLTGAVAAGLATAVTGSDHDPARLRRTARVFVRALGCTGGLVLIGGLAQGLRTYPPTAIFAMVEVLLILGPAAVAISAAMAFAVTRSSYVSGTHAMR